MRNFGTKLISSDLLDPSRAERRHISASCKAIVERINEMATRVIKLEGDDFRKIEREKKGELAKKLGI